MFYHLSPSLPYTEEHTSLLDWVRDENNTPFALPAGAVSEQCRHFWEVEGKLFFEPDNAVYAAGGNTAKVRRCIIVIADFGRGLTQGISEIASHCPPNWLDRPAVVRVGR